MNYHSEEVVALLVEHKIGFIINCEVTRQPIVGTNGSIWSMSWELSPRNPVPNIWKGFGEAKPQMGSKMWLGKIP